MNQCPKCKSTLNNDEKDSGKCFTCGATFESILSQNTLTHNNIYSENMVGKALKIVGIIILIVGSIGSFATSFHEVFGQSEFLFGRFFISETISIISGIMLLGFGEIVRLLQEIRNKLQ